MVFLSVYPHFILQMQAISTSIAHVFWCKIMKTHVKSISALLKSSFSVAYMLSPGFSGEAETPHLIHFVLDPVFDPAVRVPRSQGFFHSGFERPSTMPMGKSMKSLVIPKYPRVGTKDNKTIEPYCGWLRNPNHQWKTVVYPIIYRLSVVSTIPKWWCRG